MTIQSVPITVRREHIQDDVKRVLAELRPEWPSDQVQFEELFGGFVNAMYKCWLQDDPDPNNTIIVRIFGFKMNSEEMGKNLQKSIDEDQEGSAKLIAFLKLNEKTGNGEETNEPNGLPLKDATNETAKTNGTSIVGQAIESSGCDRIDGEKVTNGFTNANDTNGTSDPSQSNESNVTTATEIVDKTNGDQFPGEGNESDVDQGQKAQVNEKKTKSDSEKANSNLDSLFFNRLNEGNLMDMLNKQGLCSAVYGRFDNGLCYGYANGETLTSEVMRAESFIREFTRALALLHTQKVDPLPGNPFKTMQEKMRNTFDPFMKMMIKELEEHIRKSSLESYHKYPSLADINEKTLEMEAILDRIGWGDIGFCHNDLNQKNAIWNAKQQRLQLIDFEMTMHNYTSYDWAVHFVCHCGHFLEHFDMDLLPTAEFRIQVLSRYLREVRRLEGVDVAADPDQFKQDLWLLHRRVTFYMCLFFVRLVFMGPMFQFYDTMFKNPQLEENLKSDPELCARFGLQSYDGYLKVRQEADLLAEQSQPPEDFNV